MGQCQNHTKKFFKFGFSKADLQIYNVYFDEPENLKIEGFKFSRDLYYVEKISKGTFTDEEDLPVSNRIANFFLKDVRINLHLNADIPHEIFIANKVIIDVHKFCFNVTFPKCSYMSKKIEIHINDNFDIDYPAFVIKNKNCPLLIEIFINPLSSFRNNDLFHFACDNKDLVKVISYSGSNFKIISRDDIPSGN